MVDLAASAAGRRDRDRGRRRRPQPARSSPTCATASPSWRRAASHPRVLFLEAADEVAGPPVRGASAGRTRCRATAGSSTASRASASCCATCAATPTSSSTPAASTSTSCAPRSPQAFERGRRSRAARDRDVVRLQVRPAGRRRPRRRLPLPAQPALGAGAARRSPGRTPRSSDYVLGQPGAERVPRRLHRAARAGRGRLPARGQALRDPRGRLHRRQAPSVAMAEELAARLAGDGRATSRVVHRDLGRE